MRLPQLYILLVFILGVILTGIFSCARKYDTLGSFSIEDSMLQPQQLTPAVEQLRSNASRTIPNIVMNVTSRQGVLLNGQQITETIIPNASQTSLLKVGKSTSAEILLHATNAAKITTNSSRTKAVNNMGIKPMSPETVEKFHKIIEDTTRILYSESPYLDEWLAMPPLRVYVYDTIDSEYSNMEDVSACVNLRLMNMGEPLMKKRNICPWDPKDYCDDNLKASKGAHNRYRHYSSNYNNDIALIRWFQNYPHQTKDPNEADLFIVSYPQKSHCLCNLATSSRSTKCSYPMERIQENVIQKLDYYETHQERHLFFLGVDWPMAHRDLRNEVKLSLSLGPSENCRGAIDQPCGHFVTPYLARAPQYATPRTIDWFIDRPRYYSVGAAFGTPKALPLRRTFVSNQTRFLGTNVGGLPHQIIDFGNLRHFIQQDEIIDLYRNSTFCPILPGDNCPQKRFFEVIMNGCIPVVPHFNHSNEDGFPTFFRYSGFCSTRITYPFSTGTFLNDTLAGINYMDLVVPFDGFCSLDCMKPAMEKVLANATELRRLRSNLYTFSRFFRYGLGKDAYASMDAFSAIAVELRHYIRGLNDTLPSAS